MRSFFKLVTVLLFFIGSIGCFASDLEARLLNVVKNSDFLLLGNIETLNLDNKRYIVSTGVSMTKDSSPKALVGAMRIAKLRSFDALMKFIYGTVVRSDEHLETRTVITTEFGVSKRVTSDSMVTILREIGKGEMPPHIDIGNWLGKDGQYYWAIGIALPVGMN